MKKAHLSMIGISLLAACSMEPTYQRPSPPVAGNWPTGSAYRTTSADNAGTPPAEIGWRDFFTDPALQRLIQISLANNRDLRMAVLTAEETRARYQIQRAATLPEIDANAGATTTHLPNQLRFPGEPSSIYNASVGFTSFELDFFGRVHSLKDTALQQYFSTVAAQRSAQITLVAEVANAYLEWQANLELLKIAQTTADSQQQEFSKMTTAYRGGSLSQLDLQRAQAQVLTAKAAVEQYTRQAAQSENALELLIGAPVPADLPPPRPLETQGVLANLPAGLPSDVLTRRPDIIAAEDSLKAANANIGAARAAMFPRISLTGAAGLESTSLATLFSRGLTWTFAPNISVPIFDGGASRAGYEASKIDKDLYVARYEKAIQGAFREVADGLAGRGTLDRQLADQQQLVDTTSHSYDLSMMRYRAGMGDYFDALDTQRSLFTAQQTLVSLRLARLTNLVTLYKALGGGWYESTQQAGAQGARLQ